MKRITMPGVACSIALLTLFVSSTFAQEGDANVEAFPKSTALAEGVSPKALANLTDVVQGFVDDKEIVGAELLVIKNGKSILHEAFGLRDQEASLPMEIGSVFCVRSMTKPVIAASVLMLVQDKQLRLSDRASKYLPSFDVEGSKDITIEQLLTHSSGLPMSLILGLDWAKLDGIRAVAALGGGHELSFEPGSSFQYSDQGTDTLTAIVEVVSGMPAAEFVRTRVLDPLGMTHSACVMTEDSPLRAHALTKYAGSRGAWKPLWRPTDPPLFPYFLGSQGLYSTLEDYARFMDFWRSKGRVDGERLLRSRYVKKTLTPSEFEFGMPTGFPGATSEYGYLMQLWTEPDGDDKDDRREIVAFGHGGSDGTHAWVFPDQKAMVFYFTQSRGGTTSMRVEEALGNLLLGAEFNANELAPPFEEYMGYYHTAEKDDLYRAVVRDGKDLVLEIMGKGVVPLTYSGEDRWKFRDNPNVVIAFDRAESGEVTGYHIGDHQEFRFEPDPNLPSAAELAERVAKTHRLDLLETVGPIRFHSKLEMPKISVKGELTSVLAWPNRFRVDTIAGDQFEHSGFDGTALRNASTLKELEVIDGERADLALSSNLFACMGDWRKAYPDLRVVQKIKRGDVEVLVARSCGTSAPATTIYVENATGRVKRVEGLTYVDTMGRIGHRITFADYRDISGMLMPFKSSTEIANPLIGPMEVTIEDYELGVEIPEGTFELRDIADKQAASEE